MVHRAVDIASYQFRPSDKLLLDTNVWLLIYAQQKPGDRRVDIYSDAFNKILSAKSPIYIDALIVSEFITQYIRFEHQIKAPQLKLKDFRRSSDFKSVAPGVATTVKLVIKNCTQLESGFSTLNMGNLMSEYATGRVDFNDQVIEELCQKNELILVTDDGDFQGRGIPIVTANRQLLNQS